MVWFHTYGQSIISDISLEYLLSLTSAYFQNGEYSKTLFSWRNFSNPKQQNDDIEYYHHKSHTKYEIKQRPRKITHSVINPKFICISILFLNKFLLNKVNIWNAWGNEIEIQE